MNANKLIEPPVDDRADTHRLINETTGQAPVWIDTAATWAIRITWAAFGVLAAGALLKLVCVLFLEGWRLL